MLTELFVDRSSGGPDTYVVVETKMPYGGLNLHEQAEYEERMAEYIRALPALLSLADLVASGNTEYDRISEIAQGILDGLK